MKAILWAGAILLMLVMLVGLGMLLDPLCITLKVRSVYPKVNLGLLLFRVVFSYMGINEIFKAAIATFIIGLMVVSSTNDFMRRITPRKKASYRLKPVVVALYREFQIWNGYVNKNFCYLAVPPLIFSGVFF